MSQHITEWMDAYLDGELNHREQIKVESHLKQCAECRDLVAERRMLSSLLAELPPVKTQKPVEQFASEVNLMLPRRQKPIEKRTAFLWILFPIGIVFTYIGLQVFSIVTRIFEWLPGSESLVNLISTSSMSRLTLMPWMQTTVKGAMVWSGVNGIFNWGVFTWITAVIALAILYNTWLVCWWLYRRANLTGSLN
ncbi:MAG: hypothetical protein CVU39_11545 [Chloroflexi bacterium HGW-Chloroflexi-10]|nr:MAG: hypothetical protein CVU39_11545 [Chloroflexi bacterium HGW-Chloroflexi-10]